MFKIENTSLVILALSLFVLACSLMIGLVDENVFQDTSIANFILCNTLVTFMSFITWFSSYLIRDIWEG